ncbi:MAG: PQQ-binding-like beta-propeller repeat protein [Peptococcales bacterium]|jgi:outer membrane protein assembly factor BamB
MTKKRLLALLVTVVLVGILANLPYQIAAQETSFRFIHMTDTHIGSANGNKYTPAIVQDILVNYNDASFVVHSGDITETGMPQEYERYLQIIQPLQKNFYHVPGNHESRWTDAGLSYFRKYFGSTYTSWDYQGLHFVALDSSISQGQHGSLDKAMLNWLKNDLKNVDPSTPVVIFAHHPIFFDEAIDASKFMDNDWDLWSIIKDYNVVGILTGHGHKDLFWTVNDVPGIMTETVMDGGYSVIEVNKARGELIIYNRLVEGQTLTEFARLPFKKPTVKSAIKIASPEENKKLSGSFLLKADLINWATKPVKVEYKLEDFAWKPLELVNNSYQKEIDLKEIEDGIRNIWVRAVHNNGKVYLDRVTFRVEENPKIKILWETKLSGGILHGPGASEKYLYVGDKSGSVYQLDQNTGKKNWEFKTGGPIIGAPVYVNGTVYVGSGDGKVYALKATNGQKRWEFATNGAIIASPVVRGNKVFVGSSDFNFYAIDANTGKLTWNFATGNTIANSATVGNGTIYFGSWDNNFYAVDIATGEEKWRKQLGSQIYYAPAGSAPLFYKGTVVISTPAGKVFAFNGETGEQLWETSAASGLSTPVVLSGAIVYSTTSGSLYALDPETGENVWQYDTRLSGYRSWPILQGGDIILNAHKGKIMSVNTGENPMNWTINLGETYLLSNGTVNGNNIFVGTLEGKVVALEVKETSQPQTFPKLAAFLDIKDHWARKDLNKLAKMGLIKGFEDGTYRPDNSVTRAELAGMLSRYLNQTEPSSSFTTTFTDIDKHWAQQAITSLEESGIVGGYKKDGKMYYKPDVKVTRAEAIVMLSRALQLYGPSEGFISSFSDINSHWAKDAIMALEEQQLLGGYQENGKVLFKPEGRLSRAEIGVILVRMAELETK